MATKKFCLLTVGRTGSTALMDCLAQFEDIAVPGKNIDCVDNELLNPDTVKKTAEQYSRLCGKAIVRESELIECFYHYNADFHYAGFKSMPNRHKDLKGFISRQDIQFITLIRKDVVSTVASFLVAMSKGTWRRHGEPHEGKWLFLAKKHGSMALSNLLYVYQSMAQLAAIPGTIALTYEDLCHPGFKSHTLDEYFNRNIKIANPKPPTSGESYVENWDEFKKFMAQGYHQLKPQTANITPDKKAGQPQSIKK